MFFIRFFLFILLLLQFYLIYSGKNNPIIGSWSLSSAFFQTPSSSQKLSPADFQNGIKVTFTPNIKNFFPVGRKLFSFYGSAFGGGFEGVYGTSKKKLYADIQIWLDYAAKETLIQGLTLDDLLVYQDLTANVLKNPIYKIHSDTLILIGNNNTLYFVKSY